MGYFSLFSAMRISASGMSAERIRMNVIAGNIANANVTRTAQGGPYRRKEVVFSTVLDQEMDGGVKVAGIFPDPSPFKMIYEPSHPDADERGYVAMPNVDVVVEMIDMISSARAYEANLTAFKSALNMARKALEIGRR
ncbi:flagellar basal body rod protein FlgC [Candidatus Aerophobetes bacterium]|uniref:Flagellar basal-body rod protein FlgC n=1 Tax=Aerophobetes bacterium TaxID=2030807 RepID=A0A7V5HXU7_UNCAE|nr:flagellar basal body rod protein FlgC [Candidatus Aerophobetes bacterium]HHF97930.1 flagellar basal body rod protein FlgC [Candidatus Aerophobetes bacterium]